MCIQVSYGESFSFWVCIDPKVFWLGILCGILVYLLFELARHAG